MAAVATRFSDLAASDLAQDKGPAQGKGLAHGKDPVKDPVQGGDLRAVGPRHGPQADEAATHWGISDQAGLLIGHLRVAARVSVAAASAAAVVASVAVAAVVVVVVAVVVVEDPTSPSTRYRSARLSFEWSRLLSFQL